MDPSQNHNFPFNFSFPNQPPNPNVQHEHPNMQRPNNFQMSYMMPPNFSMQYPYNHPYMPYVYPPASGNNFPPTMINASNTNLTTETNTPHLSSGCVDFPGFSTQMDLGNINGDTPNNFVPPTQQSAKPKVYSIWSTEENKVLLTGYFHFSNDSELGNNQKGDTFWSKITNYVNENSESGKHRTEGKCQSHFRDSNKKISSFVGCYSAALREKKSGWSDDDYISRAKQLYHEKEHAKFNLLDEWKLFRYQPKYMTGVNESVSSGSKRKSSGEEVESSGHSLVRPEGREAAKKKARASSSKSSTSRKSNLDIQEELSNLASARQELQKSRESTVSAMLEYTRTKNLEMWMMLKNNKERDEEDEEAYNMLKTELFGR